MDQSLQRFGRLFKGVIALHGPSGGGKNEVYGSIKSIADSRGADVYYQSSGDGFREFNELIKNTPEKDLTDEMRALKVMNEGGYVRTLDLVMPSLVNLFEQYFLKRFKGEEALLVMDGYLRIGAYMSDGELVPSQIDQVSEGMLRGLQKAIVKGVESGEINLAQVNKFVQGPLLDAIWHYKPTDYKDAKREGLLGIMSEELLNHGRHIVIDIPIPDAESFMRFRSQKVLWKMENALFNKWQESDDPQLKSVLDIFGEAVLLQAGKFEITEGGEVLLNADLPDRSLKGLPKDEEYAKLVDQEMSFIVERGYRVLGLEYDPKKSNLRTFADEVNKMYNVFAKELLGEFRPDDLSNVARWKRLKEYEEKAYETMLKGEIHVDLATDLSERENIGVVKNGADLGKTTYLQLQERSRNEGQNAFAYAFEEGAKRNPEGGAPVMGERRRV